MEYMAGAIVCVALAAWDAFRRYLEARSVFESRKIDGLGDKVGELVAAMRAVDGRLTDMKNMIALRGR